MSRHQRPATAELRPLLRRVHGKLRDLATRLLDDPFAADRVVRTVLLALHQLDRETPLDLDRVEDMLIDELIRVCLERTGCPRSADPDFAHDREDEAESDAGDPEDDAGDAEDDAEDPAPDTEPCPPPAANDNGRDDESVA
jgi:hypothetical protein